MSAKVNKKTENYQRINMKRKVFAKGKKQNFKRFKKTPKYIRDNPENQVAREKEKDAYHFTDSEEEPDDLGMGIDISDLPFLDDNHENKQKELIALTQDSVRPLFANEDAYDESKLQEALVELRHKSFRSNQKETIKRILFGRSTLFISPTGSGKSLCYQLPALLYWRYRKYITIVVSPLISLTDDQMSNFPACLKAVSLHSGHNKSQRQRSIELLVKGEAQVAFISPEAIVSGVLELEDLRNLPPVGFVCIDEAHCLSEWSHNFRPAYLQFLRILNEQMSIKTYLGLTATATKATSFAIARNLIINPETDVIGSTTIPDNLILSVSYEVNKGRALIDLLKTPTFRILPSMIVYCNRRDETERLASMIRTAMQNYKTLVEVPERSSKSPKPSMDDSVRSTGSNSSSSSDKAHMKLSWHAEPYHAGLASDTRKKIQRQFIKGEIRVVVATIAFGMGINKANVRAIIHYDMPSSFEGYVQEIGRAGRDGKPAQCHMFLQADKTDIYYQQRNIYAAITEKKNLEKLTSYLFQPCICGEYPSESETEKLAARNKADPHEITSSHKTNFISTEVQVDNDDDLAEELGIQESASSGKENRPTKYVRKSVVRKHRFCKLGHEVSFGIEEATSEINLRPESIITLVCQIQQAYPQLQIKVFTPIKSTCNLFCYNGPKQMQALRLNSKPVGTGLFLYEREQVKLTGSMPEVPSRISFDVTQVARKLKQSSADVMRQLKKAEWELVDKTGDFKRSQVRVSFEGNSFHMKAVGDLNGEEMAEINNYLTDHVRLYEHLEREKIARVYNTMRCHSIPVDSMKDKDARLATSSSLKAALNAYFNNSPNKPESPQLALRDQVIDPELEEKEQKIRAIREEEIRKSATAFLSAHGNDYTPRTIARIFQGISTPNYPAEVWGPNRKWWRIHLDVDFLHLVSIINEQLSKRS